MATRTVRWVLPLVFIAPTLLSVRPATAASCSIRPKPGTPIADLPRVAQISKAEAQEKALASLGSSANPEVLEGELEVERKCLIYSFDIRVPGERGVTEIAVDAGTGSILSRTHESDRQEAAEKEHEARAPKRR